MACTSCLNKILLHIFLNSTFQICWSSLNLNEQPSMIIELPSSNGQSAFQETDTRSPGQEIPRLFTQPEVYYSVHSPKLPDPARRQMNAVHNSNVPFLNDQR
jgi:hypothetical protein